MRPKRWNDWLLLIAIFCFLGAPLGSVAILLTMEQPAYNQLQATYDPSTSRPGHFLPAGMINIVRNLLAATAMAIGLLLALIGCLRIPLIAILTRKLRDTTWVVFCLAVVALFAIAII
jgi:hypothetical protein